MRCFMANFVRRLSEKKPCFMGFVMLLKAVFAMIFVGFWASFFFFVKWFKVRSEIKHKKYVKCNFMRIIFYYLTILR